MLIKYILSPMTTARVVHRAMMVGTFRESDRPPMKNIRKPKDSKSPLTMLLPVQLELLVQFSILSTESCSVADCWLIYVHKNSDFDEGRLFYGYLLTVHIQGVHLHGYN